MKNFILTICFLVSATIIIAQNTFPEKGNAGICAIITDDSVVQNVASTAKGLQHKMKLAGQQDFDLTKDPATNTVPRERLIAAFNYSQSLATNQANKTSAA
ncbi:MAG: hypothetical protein IPO27_07625, partial [Bacteroidetes bacterium]|nr:hypothetical protein [Bacteroidota bacterium]